MKKTPLYDYHVQQGARIVDFAGYDMPLLYAGIVEEHLHTRRVGSVFDVSHMGRLEFWGADAEALLQKVCTRQLGDAQVGQSRYGHVCDENGGILDDVIVSRYEDHWFMVCNACNHDRILAWLQQHATGKDVEVKDVTDSTLMIAIQGPAVLPKLAAKLPFPLTDLKRYRFKSGSYMMTPYSVFRSGYTGEDGVELILPASIGPLLIGAVAGLAQGDDAIKPAGLGARDTLRMEAGMPLYGHELTEETDTLSAGLAWCVDLKKDFIGVGKLRDVAKNGSKRKLVGLELIGKRIARQGATVCRDGREVGKVTSGTMSPTLGKSIAMAYVDSALTSTGQKLGVDLGGKTIDAVVVPIPFYKKP